MIPVGYMYKFVAALPSTVAAKNVVDLYSVGACGGSSSRYFDDDYINYWKHNGYWFFNSPDVMEEIARENRIDLSTMTLFYYEVYEYEFDQSEAGHIQQAHFDCNQSFPTEVVIPNEKMLVGYDVTEFVCRNSPEWLLRLCTSRRRLRRLRRLRHRRQYHHS